MKGSSRPLAAPVTVWMVILLMVSDVLLVTQRAAGMNVQAVYVVNSTFSSADGVQPSLITFNFGLCSGHSPFTTTDSNAPENVFTTNAMAKWCSTGTGTRLQYPIFWSTTAPPGVYFIPYWSDKDGFQLHCSTVQFFPGDQVPLASGESYSTYTPGSSLLTMAEPWSKTNLTASSNAERLLTSHNAFPTDFFRYSMVGGLDASAICTGSLFNTMVYLPPNTTAQNGGVTLILQVDTLDLTTVITHSLTASHHSQCGRVVDCESRTSVSMIRLLTPSFMEAQRYHKEDNSYSINWVGDGGLSFMVDVDLCNQSLSNTVNKKTGKLLQSGFLGMLATAPAHYSILALPDELTEAILSWISMRVADSSHNVWSSGVCRTEKDLNHVSDYVWNGKVTVCELPVAVANLLPRLHFTFHEQQVLFSRRYTGRRNEDGLPIFAAIDEQTPLSEFIVDLGTLVDFTTNQIRIYSTGSIAEFASRNIRVVVGLGILQGTTIATSRNVVDSTGTVNRDEVWGLPVLLTASPSPPPSLSETVGSTIQVCMEPVVCNDDLMHFKALNRCGSMWCVGLIPISYDPETLSCSVNILWTSIAIGLLVLLLATDILYTKFSQTFGRLLFTQSA